MSLGHPSQLGTLLIQRLDTLFGLTQSQQVNLSTGARPDAVFPTEKSHPGPALKNPGTRPLPNAQGSTGRAQSAQQASDQARGPAGRAAQTAQPHQSIQTNFGRTAQLILQLLHQQPQAQGLHARQPLLSAAQHAALSQSAQSASASSANQPLSQTIQHLLSNELRHSGLFYESQLLRHMQGQLPNKNPLLQQPQNQGPQSSANQSARATAHGSQTGGTTGGAAQASAQPSPPTTTAEGLRSYLASSSTTQGGQGNPLAAAQTGAQAATAPTTHQSLAALPEHLYPLVRQQLELLATSQLDWRGELWPGAPMHWQLQPIDDDEPSTQAPRQQAEQGWHTHLEIHLPQMGRLDFQVYWSPAQLRIQIKAQEQTLKVLRGFAPILHERLSPLAQSLQIEFTPPRDPAPTANSAPSATHPPLESSHDY